jgi:hypothetical protein
MLRAWRRWVTPSAVALGCLLRLYGVERPRRDGRVYLAAAIALAPAVAWYAWAHHFWTFDGDSLGLADEAHLIGPDVVLSRAAAISPQGRIAVSGLAGRDDTGHRIAFNDPTFFAFADRKGFVYDRRDSSLATIEALRRRGARYWIVAEDDLRNSKLARNAVARRFGRLASCPAGYALYDLSPLRETGSSRGAGNRGRLDDLPRDGPGDAALAGTRDSP